MFGINFYGINWKEDSQKTRILKILEKNKGKYVSAWDLVFKTKVLHYCESIRLLRKAGCIIENKKEWKGRVLHSYYRLT